MEGGGKNSVVLMRKAETTNASIIYSNEIIRYHG